MTVEEVRRLLKDLGIRQRELAWYLGVSDATLSKALASDEALQAFGRRRENLFLDIRRLRDPETFQVVEQVMAVRKLSRLLAETLHMPADSARAVAESLVEQWMVRPQQPGAAEEEAPRTPAY